jgi:hypothetical protein
LKFSPRKSSPSQPQVFFPTPDLYFAVHYEPRPDCKNWVNVLCEGHPEGKAICAFLSPIDAMLEAVCSSKPGKRFEAIPARKFEPSIFIQDHQGRLALDVHLGWPARDGQLIARPSGKPASCAAYHEMQVPPEHASHIVFTLQDDTLTAMDQLFQSAGLFAYKETFATVHNWPRARRDKVVTHAIRKAWPLAPAGTELNQVALFDPEAEQWHFVSTAPLDALDIQEEGADL